MPSHDLNTSLNSKGRTPQKRRPSVAPVVVAAGFLLAVFAAIWIAVVDDPDGGRAVAVAAISDAEPAATGSIPASADAGAEDIDPASGGEVQVASLPALPHAGLASSGLFEQSAFGPLPRIAPDGRRPRDVYARPTTDNPSGGPRIVLVVTGLGLSQTGTQKAIEGLPEDVTLAFAPYGASLQRWVDKARAEGHEVLLQVPLEPIGYPEHNPGEHTLLVSNDRASRLQDLNWVLSRVSGYAGVMNHMGARFLNDEDATLPFLGEIGRRGLFYLDDGSVPESRAAAAGTALDVPVLIADVILDRHRSEQDIALQLEALQEIATTNGVAVGVASAFPESVAALAQWAHSAQEQGFTLVPATAALLR